MAQDAAGEKAFQIWTRSGGMLRSVRKMTARGPGPMRASWMTGMGWDDRDGEKAFQVWTCSAWKLPEIENLAIRCLVAAGGCAAPS